MNEVKRYTLVGDMDGNCNLNEARMEVCASGEYIRTRDYAKLQEQLTATTNSLTNAQEALKSAGIEADTVQAGVMELVNRMNQVVAENALMLADYRDIPEMRRIGAPLTPATDAHLNAARAEGVDMFIGELSELFRSLKPGGKPWQAVKGIAMRATSFAAQLRAGNAGKDGSHE